MKLEILRLQKLKSDRKQMEKALDALWREVALLRAGDKCEWWGCYERSGLNVHHVFSRSRRSVRWDLENAMVLCSNHHALNTESAHKDPSFLKKVLGEIPGYRPIRTQAWWIMLYQRAYVPRKVDCAMEKLYLENERKNQAKQSNVV
jgi:hypothetical protein